MERNLFTNDFEQLLKENADKFKMSPSKKVWHGIYNDLHPGRRWPSVAIGLVFVFTLILVGHLNVSPGRHSNLSHALTNAAILKNEKELLTRQLASKNANKDLALNNKNLSTQSHTKEQLKRGTIEKGFKQNLALPSDKRIDITNSVQTNSGGIISQVFVAAGNDLVANIDIANPKDQNLSVNKSDKSANNIFPVKQLPEETAPFTTLNVLPALISYRSLDNIDNDIKTGAVNDVEHPANEENKKVSLPRQKIRRNAKISWAYYLSPSISYRMYSKQGDPADQNLLGYTNSLTNLTLSEAVTHTPSVGLEGGMAMKYSLAKRLKFTGGFQTNYSAYTIQANNIHPIIATLILHNVKTGSPYPISSISYFGNGPGNVPVNLHNYSIQFSLPVGLEYQLAGNDRVQFFAAGSIQPSVVVANNIYILSTDKRNYITDPSLERTWNIGTNIGTFISFNSNKFNWQIGPQVHYELLSSYGNEYQVKEHFIDYGIRFSVSKILK